MASNKVDPKTAESIEQDMAEIDGKVAPPTGETKPCDCSGGPGLNKDLSKRGTGLIDDNTLCPKCDGHGIVPA